MRHNAEVQAIARRLLVNPKDRAAELELLELVRRYGDWVYDAAVDVLTEGTPGTYPQALQDRMRQQYGGLATGGERDDRIAVASFERLEEAVTGEDVIFALLIDLTPADYYAIPKEAHLSPVERDVWEYWLQGIPIGTIADYICKRDGHVYRTNSVRRILYRAQGKVTGCPHLGWRTALAEDISRGKQHKMPIKVGWLEVRRALWDSSSGSVSPDIQDIPARTP